MSRTILGKRPALAAEGEKQVFSSPNSVLTSPCEHPNDLWTQPKVSSEEKATRLPPIRSLFFHHYDWNRWFASLATTVDNTIEMADRSFNNGRQWCIRRIGDELTLSLAKNSHFSFLPSHFPSLPSRTGHHCGAEIRNEFTLSIAKKSFALFVPPL